MTIAFALATSGCSSLPSLPSMPSLSDWGYRSIIVSRKPGNVVSACIVEAWRKSFAAVTQVAGARSSEVRAEEAGRVLFHVEIVSASAGSTVIYTTPYGFARPVGRSYEDAQTCAAL